MNLIRENIKAIVGMITIVAAIVGALSYFAKADDLKAVKVELTEELAGVSLNQQRIGLEGHIRWLEQQVASLEIEYGDEKNMPPRVRQQYHKYSRELEDVRMDLREVKKRLLPGS